MCTETKVWGRAVEATATPLLDQPDMKSEPLGRCDPVRYPKVRGSASGDVLQAYASQKGTHQGAICGSADPTIPKLRRLILWYASSNVTINASARSLIKKWTIRVGISPYGERLRLQAAHSWSQHLPSLACSTICSSRPRFMRLSRKSESSARSWKLILGLPINAAGRGASSGRRRRLGSRG